MVTITLRASDRLYSQILMRTSDNRPFEAMLNFIPSKGGKELEQEKIKVFSIDQDGKTPEVERVKAVHKQLELEKKVENLTKRCEALQQAYDSVQEELQTYTTGGKSNGADAQLKTIARAFGLSPMAMLDRKKPQE